MTAAPGVEGLACDLARAGRGEDRARRSPRQNWRLRGLLWAGAALLAVGSIDGIVAARAQDTAEQEAQIADAAAISVLPTDPEPSGLLASVQVERTGTLFVGDVVVEVYNGTPGLEGLIAWSFAQFHAHGLGTPNVHRVSFHTRSIDKCQDVNGLILGDAVTLCFDSAAACMDQHCTDWRTWTKKTTLHELAHAWIHEHLTTEVIERFQTATAAPTWSDDQAHAWSERGVEMAAETIAWATADQPVRVNLKLRPRSCDELARDYEILTGRQPEPTPPGCEPSPPGRPRSPTDPR